MAYSSAAEPCKRNPTSPNKFKSENNLSCQKFISNVDLTEWFNVRVFNLITIHAQGTTPQDSCLK